MSSCECGRGGLYVFTKRKSDCSKGSRKIGSSAGELFASICKQHRQAWASSKPLSLYHRHTQNFGQVGPLPPSRNGAKSCYKPNRWDRGEGEQSSCVMMHVGQGLVAREICSFYKVVLVRESFPTRPSFAPLFVGLCHGFDTRLQLFRIIVMKVSAVRRRGHCESTG